MNTVRRLLPGTALTVALTVVDLAITSYHE
jgi:hypothetical protein